jgi:hypothetical protein
MPNTRNDRLPAAERNKRTIAEIFDHFFTPVSPTPTAKRYKLKKLIIPKSIFAPEGESDEDAESVIKVAAGKTTLRRRNRQPKINTYIPIRRTKKALCRSDDLGVSFET